MDWIEKARKELEGRQMREKSVRANVALINESGILEKIEKERLKAQKGTTYVFTLHPYHIEGVSDVIVDSNRFARGGTKYTVGCQFGTFSIYVTEDGIYLEFNGEGKKRIDPKKITDKEIHEWFGFLVERPSFLKTLFRGLWEYFRK
jgi:hypothetical protein